VSERSLVRLDHDGALTVLTVDRPDKLNALDAEVLGELEGAVRAVAERSETRAMIVTGSGKAFVAGADIAAMKAMTPEDARAFASLGHRVFASLETLHCPVIAAVNGFALGGGCELALACDFIYASEKAKFGQPEVKLGVIPGFGGTQRLARRVGIARARELIFTGAVIGADEASRLGLVSRVVPPDELLTVARDTAQTIASMGPVAVREAKRVLLEGADRLLGEANALEIEAFAGCFGTEDQSEGMEAFLGKRTPTFQNR
jgi:enoyl-CoA hydratase